MAARTITIEDVARATGVSRQTVSRVINRHPSVRPAVRERVEAAIADLGYSPNLAARRMGGARSYLIMAINDRQRTIENWQAGRGNDWVDQMLHGGMLACEEHGYHMLFELVDTRGGVAERQLSAILAGLRPDGVILTPPHSENEKLAKLLKDRNCPFVQVGTAARDGAIVVGMDEEGAARAATRHLIDLGHRRIGFLSGRLDYGNTGLRVGGYTDEMQRIGESPLAEVGDFEFDRAADITSAWLRSERRPTAIIAENDEMAFAALHIANRIGIGVPAELSLVTFEDTPGVRFSVPPLTAIRQPTAAIIARSCELLIAIARGESVERKHVLPFELIVRETTARCPGS